MSTAVFVAGAGVISSIGNNLTDCLSALENGIAGIDHIKYLNTNHQGSLPVGEVKLSNDELATLSGFSTAASRTAMLSMLAAREALNDSCVNDVPGLRLGFVSANTAGGIDKTENFFNEFASDRRKGRLRDMIYHECGTITNMVAAKLGIKTNISTISTACSSSANAIMYAARLIKHNMVDAVVAGGTDALTRFSLNGFNTLMVLDNKYCKPFDEHRNGLNLGEGAGYVVLVSEKVAAQMSKNVYCSLSGYCNANDAYHQTSTSPEGNGPFWAMTGALEMSGLQPRDIDYINLHGTGTHNNDSSEGAAVERLFTYPYPKMSSTKSFTGHTLGASASVEAVFSALAVQRGLVYPNLRLQTPMAELPFVPETKFSKQADLKHVLSNSFGFGGNCSSLIFSKL